MPLPARHAPFVGRERELGLLFARLEAAHGGEGGVALVAGEPGIGKTRLLAELAAQARQLSWTVLTGRAYETAGMPPYLPFTEALREFIGDRSAAEVKAALGNGATEVARLVPQLRDLLPDLVELPALGPDQERYRLFEGISGALLGIARAGESGLLLVLDDLHWADASSLALLQHLVGKLADAPLYLALGYRTIDPTVAGALQEVLAEISRAGIATHLPLSGFTAPETALLLTSLSGRKPAAQVVVAVQVATEGSPFFVGELARQLASEERDLSDPAVGGVPLGVPDGVRQVVGKRLSRLTAQANRALQAASVLNDGFSFEVLQRASGLDAAVVLEVADEALAAGMLQEEGGGFAFTHALIRRTLYDGLSLPRRQRLHLQAGQALEAAYPGKPAALVPAIAMHFRLAGETADQEKLLRYTVQAARQAQGVFAFREAARLFEEALEIQAALRPDDHTSRCDLLLALGEALVPAGEHRRAADQVAEEAFALAEALPDRDRAARVAALAAQALVAKRFFFGGQSPAFSRWTDRLDRYAADGTPERVQADSWIAQQHIYRFTPEDLVEFRFRSQRALALARELGDAKSLFRAGTVVVNFGAGSQDEQEQKLRVAEELLAAPRQGASSLDLCIVLYFSSQLLLNWGLRTQAEAAVRELERLAGRTDDPVAGIINLAVKAGLAVIDGDLAHALELGDETFALARTADMQGAADSVVGSIPYVDALVGIERKREWMQGAGDSPPTRRGSQADALAALHESITSLGIDERRDLPILLVSHFLGEAISINDAPAAALLATRFDRLAGQSMAGYFQPSYARLLGSAAVLNGDREQAIAYFRQAIANAAKIGYRPEVALSRLALAEALDGGTAEEQREADEHLAFVLPEFEQMGMRPALEQARRLQVTFAAAEIRTAVGTPSYPGGLSEREVEVLRLVAKGKTNGEIAAVLVMSVRTVERHISTIYGKIGASGPTARVTASTYARQHGLDAPAGTLTPS